MADTCIEPVPISDVYSDGIAYIENLGNCIRVAYFTWSRSGGGPPEKVIVAKIVRPVSSLIPYEDMLKMIEQEPIAGMIPEKDGRRAH